MLTASGTNGSGPLTLTRGDRWALAQCLVLSCVMAAIVLAVPVFMLQLYDRILPSASTDTLWVLTAIALALLALYGLLDHLRARLLQSVGATLELRAVERAPLAGLGNGDLDRLRMAAQSNAPAALLDLPGIPLFLLVLAILHPWLAVFAACIAFSLLLVSSLGSGPRLKGLAPDPLARVLDGSERQWMAPLQQRAVERMCERRSEQRLADLDDLARRSRVAASLKSLRLAAQIGCLALGGYLAIHGDIAPAAIVAATIVMSRALAPIEQLAGGWVVLREGWEAWKALRQLPPELQDHDRIPCEDVPDIRFEQAVITPPGAERPILRSLDLHLLPGTVLGVVGGAGTGKSALLRAISGEWPLRLGRVLVGGRDPRSLESSEHRQIFGMVEQDPSLFSGSIAENIAGFAAEADAHTILAAARAAGVHQAILAEPGGYAREVGPRGRDLSASLRCGISLAAALYNDPHILLLDGPFDHLDMACSHRLNQAISTWMTPERIVIMTAKRLEDATGASHLVVLGEGRLQAGGVQRDVVAWLHSRQAAKPALPRQNGRTRGLRSA